LSVWIIVKKTLQIETAQMRFTFGIALGLSRLRRGASFLERSVLGRTMSELVFPTHTLDLDYQLDITA